MLNGFIEQEILEGKIWYFSLHPELNDRATIDFQLDYEAVVRQQQSQQQLQQQIPRQQREQPKERSRRIDSQA